VFRYGSRKPVLNIGRKARTAEIRRKAADGVETPPYNSIKPRPRARKLFGSTVMTHIGCGKLYITVNRDERQQISEVFTTTGRAGGCPSQSEATSRLVSLALRSGVSVNALTEQLKGIRCLSTLRKNNFKNAECAPSCPAAIARAIEGSLVDESGSPQAGTDQYDPMPLPGIRSKPDLREVEDPDAHERERRLLAKGLCPDCLAKVEHEGGCVVCRLCGFSKCG
jgi:ribonucleoside-diphosphate reductase alpha chain